MAPISIVYHAADGEQWTRHFYKLISQDGAVSDVGLLDVNDNFSGLQNTMDTSLVVAVMVSPCMLQPEMEKVFKALKRYENRNLVLLNCFLEEDEQEEILDRFTFLQSLKLLKVTVDTYENIDLVSVLLDEVDIAERAARKRRHKGNVSKFRVIPSTVYQQDALVYLNFEQEVRGTVTVSFGKSKENRIETEVYNPFSVTFTAQNLSEGKNKMYVFVDDNLVGKWELLLQSPMLAAFESPMFLCQALCVYPNDKEALDKRLVDIFKDSVPDDQSHVSLLGKCLRDDLPDSQSSAEIPSLLHFAAKNGLSDLCSRLLNIPGASNVCRIANIRGKNASDLANESGFLDLANYMKLFLDTEAMVIACDTVYLNKYRFRTNQASSVSKEDNQRQTKTSKSSDSQNPYQQSSTKDLHLPTNTENAIPKQIRYSRKDSQKFGNLYSLKRQAPDQPVRSQSSKRNIQDRPPQPIPRFCSPGPETRARDRYQSETDLHEHKIYDTMELQLSHIYDYISESHPEDDNQRQTKPSKSRDSQDPYRQFSTKDLHLPAGPEDDNQRQTKPSKSRDSQDPYRQFSTKDLHLPAGPGDRYSKQEFASGSKAMDELSEITRQTMEKRITMQDAEMLYESWKKRNQNPSLSIRQKQQNLQELKDKYEHLIGESQEDNKYAINGILGMLRKKLSSKKKKEVNIQISSPLVEESRSNTSSNRSSDSREGHLNTDSRDGMDSGGLEESDSDEYVEQETTYSEMGKKMKEYMKTSKRDMFLRSISNALEEVVPPPIPPRKPKEAVFKY